MPCSNAANMRNPLKFAGMPQTRQQISAVSRPKFTILSGHVEGVLLSNNFFPIDDTCLSSEDIARESCAMVPKWRFLRPVFPASRVQHISDLDGKFALGSHHVWKYMVDIESAAAEIRRGKKDRRKKKKPQGKNIMACPIPQVGHNKATIDTEVMQRRTQRGIKEFISPILPCVVRQRDSKWEVPNQINI